jgi:ATP-dependent exoDNAse (exonuclease V) alpha subunit
VTIQLNAEQHQAVDMARWLVQQPGRIGILSGPAGSGKTTTLKTIMDEVGTPVVVAPTNRAALRSAEVSGRPAKTIHTHVYKPQPRPDGSVEFRRKLASEIERPANGLVVCDESSMVGPAVWEDLWWAVQTADASLLIVGDAFQLPPVTPADKPFSVFGPEFLAACKQADIPVQRVDLVRVWRQALESPVLRAATELREHPDDWAAACRVIEGLPAVGRVVERVAGMVSDQIDHVAITYTNDLRRHINRKVRASFGWDDNQEPQVGEPLLVRRSNKKAGLYNGQVIPFGGYHELPYRHPPQYRAIKPNDVLTLIDVNVLLDGTSADASQVKGLRLPYVDVNFGYALTCHASQGCEYDHVVVQWETSIVRMMPVDMRIRWMYTAVTRAKKKVWIGGLP